MGITNGNRSIAIFDTKSGCPPTFYSNSNVENYYFTSYDAQGNLFAVAFTFARGYRLYELAKGRSTLKEVKVPFKIYCPDWIQWDGTDLAIDAARQRNNALVYRIRISNYRATIVGKLKLRAGATYTVQSWIEGKTIVHPDHYNEDVAFWKYPTGGKAWKTFVDAGAYIMGVTVSNPSK